MIREKCIEHIERMRRVILLSEECYREVVLLITFAGETIYLGGTGLHRRKRESVFIEGRIASFVGTIIDTGDIPTIPVEGDKRLIVTTNILKVGLIELVNSFAFTGVDIFFGSLDRYVFMEISEKLIEASETIIRGSTVGRVDRDLWQDE